MKVDRTRLKRVLIYAKIDNATLSFVTTDISCKLYFKRDYISKLRTSRFLTSQFGPGAV